MRGGLFMEFINVKNEAGTTIINDSYDNLVYLSSPKQKEAVLWTGSNIAVSADVLIPTQLKTYTPLMVPTMLYQYGIGGANAIRITYIPQPNYHGDAPLIAISVPQGYEFKAQWICRKMEGFLALIVDVVKGGASVTQEMIDEVKNGIKFYCFGYFEDVAANANTPRIRFVDKVGSSKPNIALQVLGKHKFFKASWKDEYNIKNDVIYDSRIRYLRVIDQYHQDWYSTLSKYSPNEHTKMTVPSKSYDCDIAVIPMSVIDAAVWGPNITKGDNQSHTGSVWQTVHFTGKRSIEIKSYQKIYWDTVTPYPMGCAGQTATQYMVVDVTGYDKASGMPFN